MTRPLFSDEQDQRQEGPVVPPGVPRHATVRPVRDGGAPERAARLRRGLLHGRRRQGPSTHANPHENVT